VTDPLIEWKGMPEFVQDDAQPVQKIVVNFASPEDVQTFARLVGYDLTPKSRSIWFPYRERVNRKALEYVDDNARADG
jgi:hypothetical protein